MKTATFSLLVLGLGAAASVVDHIPSRVRRDLPTITNVINSVGEKLNALDAAAVAFNGGDSTAFQSAATSLETTIQDGLTQVQGTSELTLTDAVGLQSQVTVLQEAATKLVTDLAAKKTQVQDAGLCTTVLDQSTRLNDLSQKLIDGITSKVPAAAQSIASQLTAGFTAALQQNTANFAQGNCTNAAGAPAAGAGGASPSPSPAPAPAPAPASPATNKPPPAGVATAKAATGSGAATAKVVPTAKAATAAEPTAKGAGTAKVTPTAKGPYTPGTASAAPATGAPQPTAPSTPSTPSTPGGGGEVPVPGNATSTAPVTVSTAGAALHAIPIGGLALGLAALLV